MGTTTIIKPTDRSAKNFYRKIVQGKDFSNQNLDHADFRMASVVNCNFDFANLSNANFEGANLRGSSFVGTICKRTNFKDCSLSNARFEPKDVFGATFTFECSTFEGMKVAKLWWYLWIMMLLMMKPTDCEEQERETMELKLIEYIGPERYERLKHIMRNRIF